VTADPDLSRDDEIDPLVRRLLPGDRLAGGVLQDLAAAENPAEILPVEGLQLRDLPERLNDLAVSLENLHVLPRPSRNDPTRGRSFHERLEPENVNRTP